MRWWTLGAEKLDVGGAGLMLGPVTLCWGRWFGPLWIELHCMNRLVKRWTVDEKAIAA